MFVLVYMLALQCNAFGSCDYSPMITKEFNTHAECRLYLYENINNPWKRYNQILTNCEKR